ncbi:MAG: PAS domain-containing sensor histidine kinase [Ottowia sp.]|nr:PAS domain-containing sensor histidine kinase [Ottowia sp.]
MNNKKLQFDKHYEILDAIFNLMPFLFWKDKNGVYQGANFNQAKNLGFSSPLDFVGKTVFEFLKDQEAAAEIDKNDKEVMDTKTTRIIEERMIIEGEEKYYLSQKSPLFNPMGETVGMVGFSVDVTDLAKKRESDRKEINDFVNIAAQVVHDIRSPAASLLMLAKSCTDIPERERLSLREAAKTIQEIADSLLRRYKKNNTPPTLFDEQKTVLVSDALLKILVEKQFQYQEQNINLDYIFHQSSHFDCIKISLTDFKRMISNLINNAVQALDKKQKNIVLKLEEYLGDVKITIQDNGKGIQPQLIDKIINDVAINEEEKNGHGIGLTQVREALRHSQGQLEIMSHVGRGSQISITFPKVTTPDWITQKIQLNLNSVVLVLDDKSSQQTWENYFSPALLSKEKKINFYFFSQTKDLLNHINLSAQKENIVLIVSHDILKQEENSLETIKNSGITHTTILTRHYPNEETRAYADGVNAKILPKNILQGVSLKVEKEKKEGKEKSIDIVMVEDNKGFADSIIFCFSQFNIKHYQNPYSFIKKINEYDRNIGILIDYDFKGREINGIELAAHLHDNGFNKIAIVSGREFDQDHFPKYIKYILKTDLNELEKFINLQKKPNE